LKLLLDTHIALWAVIGSEKLGEAARRMIADGANSVHVSAVSVFEIAVKHRLQRGSVNDMPIDGSEALVAFRVAGYALLPITPDHAAAVDGLDAIHADPFDRLLVAQAVSEPIHLLTRDARLPAYSPLVVQV
jgi:PIN domain nuclease of toxin-antitoxin system